MMEFTCGDEEQIKLQQWETMKWKRRIEKPGKPLPVFP